MPIISIVNYFLVIVLIAILAFGVLLIMRHQQRSVYRRFLVTMLLFWMVVMLGMVYKFRSDGLTLILNLGVMNMQILILGLPCFFTLISFPAAILNSKLITIKNWVLLTFPMVALLAIYFAWHIIMGGDPFILYNYAELWQNILTPTVIMRFIIVASFIGYIISMQMALWRVVPIYNQYIQDNISNNLYNIDWVRTLIKYIGGVSLAYFLMTFSNSLYVNTIYLLSVIALFSYIIDRSLFYRTLDDIPPIRLKWSKESGWYVCALSNVEASIKEPVVQRDIVGRQIDVWMDHTMKYTNPDFMTDDILLAFPNLTHDDLATIFKSRGENFQSYVRRFRIKRACEIMDGQSDDIYPKQVFSMVGFSHYSSFSRSFQAVVGHSPSEYRKMTKETK